MFVNGKFRVTIALLFVARSPAGDETLARKTKEEAMETRAQLLDAAERIFSDKGVTNTSLSDIAEAAGVTRGAIYHHFKNKLDLIEALWERVSMPLDELRACSEARNADSPLNQIRDNALTILRHAITDPHHRAVANIIFLKCEYVDEVLPIRQRHIEGRNECAADVEAQFARAIAAGELPAHTDARQATMGLFGFLDGLLYNWLLDVSYFDLERDAARYVDIYFFGLKHAPAISTARACTPCGQA